MKKLIKWMILAVVLCLTVAAMCACDALTGNTENASNTQKSDNTTKTTEEKISLAKAVENYESQDVKSAELKTFTGMEFYVPMGDTFKPAAFGVEMDLKRIQNGEKTYGEGSIASGDKYTQVVSLLDAIQDYGGLFSGFGKSDSQEGTKEVLNEIGPVLDYFKKFLNQELLCDAKFGYLNETLNLKARYKRTDTHEEESLWCGASVNAVSQIVSGGLNNESAIKYLSSPMVKLAVGIEGEDTESERVTSEGIAKYKFTPKIAESTKSISEVLKGLFDVIGVQFNEKLVSQIIVNIGKWVTIDNESTVNVQVGSDKLPALMSYKMKVTINAPESELRKTFKSLQEYGLGDNAFKIINTMIFVLGQKVCGANGEKGYIGLSFTTDLTETYSYAASDCKLEGKDEDLYKPISPEIENRIELDGFVRVLTDDEINEYVGKVLALLRDRDSALELSASINDSLREKTGIRLLDLFRIIAGEIREYAKTHESLKTELESLAQDVLSGKIKINLKSETKVNVDENGVSVEEETEDEVE